MFNSSYQTDRILIDWADRDDVWGPLLFLRPKPTEYLGVGRIFLASLLIGTVQGMAANLGMALAHRLTGHEMLPVHTLPMVLTLSLALVFQLSFGRVWNRRVEQLARQRAWARDTER
jgi:hypothetical protein